MKIEHFSKNNFNIYTWGFGKTENAEDWFSLSKPRGETLLDRNVIVKFGENKITVENDWLGSIPVFYNEKDLIISTLCLKTLTDKKIDEEGLYYYLRFGYSVFEQTPFRNVKFMRYFSKIIMNNSKIIIEKKEDPINEIDFNTQVYEEKNLLKKLENDINTESIKKHDEIFIPTSGGYDSRLLNVLVKEKHKIRSFSYGVSKKQTDSYEVVNAKRISEILNTEWSYIKLGNFHKYISQWYSLYGFSVHLHGMYHIEFYENILQTNSLSSSPAFLSGIIGDAWSGKVKINEIKRPEDLLKLGYTHGMGIPEKVMMLQNTKHKLRDLFFEDHKSSLKSDKIRIIFSMRLKLILLSYLITIPEYFGFTVYTPFLKFDNVIAMLTLNEERRRNRKWQTDFFSKYNLDLESRGTKLNKSNMLDYEAFKSFINTGNKFEKINTDRLLSYISKEYLDKVNNKIHKNPCVVEESLNSIIAKYRYIRGGLRLIGINNSTLMCLHSYQILKAIDFTLSCN